VTGVRPGVFALRKPQDRGSTSDENTPKFWPEPEPELEWGTGKSGFRRTKALISLKRDKIGLRLLLRTNRKSHRRFRLVPKSTTLDDLEGSFALCFKTRAPWCCYLFIFSFTFNLLLVNKLLQVITIYNCLDLSQPEANNNHRVIGRRKNAASRGFLATTTALVRFRCRANFA